jgi:hypothetical protein
MRSSCSRSLVKSAARSLKPFGLGFMFLRVPGGWLCVPVVQGSPPSFPAPPHLVVRSISLFMASIRVSHTRPCLPRRFSFCCCDESVLHTAPGLGGTRRQSRALRTFTVSVRRLCSINGVMTTKMEMVKDLEAQGPGVEQPSESCCPVGC